MKGGPIGIVGALRWELSPLERKLKLRRVEREGGIVLIVGTHEEHEVVLAIGGIGQTRASHASQILVDRFKPQVVISAGFAGALDASLQPGDLILGEVILRTVGSRQSAVGRVRSWEIGEQPIQQEVEPVAFSTPALVAKAEDEAMALGLRYRRGMLLSLDVMLTESYEKKEAASSGALAVEMEGAAIAQIASSSGLPFLAVRSISDALDQDLGLDFNKLLHGRGRLSYKRTFLALLTHLSALPSVWRLKRTAHQARRSLAAFLPRLLPQLDPPASDIHHPL